MKKLYLSFVFIATLALSLASMASAAEDDTIKNLIGTYEGKAANGGGLYPVTTTFTMAIGNRLSGSYEVHGEDMTFRGHLSNVMFEGPRTLSMQWTDKDGEGFVTMEFSSDFKSFTGGWTDKRSSDPMPWTGKKQ